MKQGLDSMSKKRFLKQIKSFESLIGIHKEKINKEKTKLIPNTNLIKHWEKEIQVFSDEITKVEKRLKRGG